MQKVYIINVFEKTISEIFQEDSKVDYALLKMARQQRVPQIGIFQDDNIYRVHNIKGLGIQLNKTYFSGSVFVIAQNDKLITCNTDFNFIKDNLEFVINPEYEIIRLLRNYKISLNKVYTTDTSSVETYKDIIKKCKNSSTTQKYEIFRLSYSANLAFDTGENRVEDVYKIINKINSY